MKKIYLAIISFTIISINFYTMQGAASTPLKPQGNFIFLNNNTKQNIWSSVKIGGALSSQDQHTYHRKSNGITLYNDIIPAGKAIFFPINYDDTNNITIRIFSNQQDFSTYNRNKSKLAIVYHLNTLKEFKVISITYDSSTNKFGENKSQGFIGLLCDICNQKIQSDHQMALVFPCGHKYHKECLLANSYQCPDYVFPNHEEGQKTQSIMLFDTKTARPIQE